MWEDEWRVGVCLVLIVFYLEWVVIYYHFHHIYVVHLGEQACE